MTVTLTARDAFGAPVPDAGIMLLKSTPPNTVELSKRTDADGHAEIVGNFRDVYAAIFSAADLWGVSYEPGHPADNHIDIEAVLHPSSALTPGVGQLSVTGSSPDGRLLEFSARLYVVEGNASEEQDLEAWNIGAVGVLPCAADCVAGPSGLDAAYEGSVLRQSWVDPDPALIPWRSRCYWTRGEASP